jgi:hypothetical protein
MKPFDDMSDPMRSPQIFEEDDRLTSFSGLENSLGFRALKRAQAEALQLRKATADYAHQFDVDSPSHSTKANETDISEDAIKEKEDDTSDAKPGVTERSESAILSEEENHISLPDSSKSIDDKIEGEAFQNKTSADDALDNGQCNNIKTNVPHQEALPQNTDETQPDIIDFNSLDRSHLTPSQQESLEMLTSIYHTSDGNANIPERQTAVI